MYQGGSDSFLAPRDRIEIADESYGIDFEAEIAVITGDVAMACSREEAAAAIRLVVLVNDVSLRNLIPAELAKGFGFFQSKPSSALSPAAVTPDELGEAWDGGRSTCRFSRLSTASPSASPMPDRHDLRLPDLDCPCRKTRPLGAGTIIGSGTVSNKDKDGGPGKPIAEGGLGYSCIAEQRTVETIVGGERRERRSCASATGSGSR